MDKALFRSIAPYVVGLAVAGALYIYSGTFEYTPPPRPLGPAVLPLLAILLSAASCLFELTRRLIIGGKEATGFMEAFDREPQTEQAQPVYPRLVIGGVVLMAFYAVLVPILGFILATFLFLAAFMYVGGFRPHLSPLVASAPVPVFR